MKKVAISLPLLLVAVIFSNCKKDNISGDVLAPAEPVEVWFSTNIADLSKASGASWAPNDAIGIFMLKAGLPITPENIAENADNRKYITLGGSGTFSPDTDQAIYYPVEATQSVDFLAYYPYKIYINSSSPTYSINLADQSSPDAIDLMYADKVIAKDKNSAPFTLNFRHLLAKIAFNVSPGSGIAAADLVGMRVTIKGMNTNANFNMATGMFSGGTTPQDIVAKTSPDGARSEAIILPEEVASMVVEFKLNSSRTDTFTSQVVLNKNFERAKIHEYTVTISPTGISMSATITDWGVGYGGTLTAN